MRVRHALLSVLLGLSATLARAAPPRDLVHAEGFESEGVDVAVSGVIPLFIPNTDHALDVTVDALGPGPATGVVVTIVPGPNATPATASVCPLEVEGDVRRWRVGTVTPGMPVTCRMTHVAGAELERWFDLFVDHDGLDPHANNDEARVVGSAMDAPR